MLSRTPRFLLSMTLAIVSLSSPLAQAQQRELFKKPEKPAEYWEAIKFEIAVGKYDLAATYLKGLLAAMPSDEDLLQIEEREGLSSFLRLRTVPRWLDDPKLDKEVHEQVELLLGQVTKALQTKLSDPQRTGKFIRNLSASAEERAFAIQQLQRAGSSAVPYLITALRQAEPNSPQQTGILVALPRLGSRAMPALLAALDIDDPMLKLQLLDVIRQRRATEAIPYLWFPSASPKEQPIVRQRSAATLAGLLGITADKLPPAPVGLTQEAERYYNHKISFINPAQETVWQWDGKELVSQVMTATQAEEFYGLAFARKALMLDPTFRPAQIVFLSIALDKGIERAGIDQPLSKGAPTARELALSVNPDLLITVLDRALAERRTPVVLGAVRALGEVTEVRATRSDAKGPPALVRALNYPDRRVQMAAVDSLLRIPGSSAAGARIVDVLRRNLGAETTAKVVVVDYNQQRRESLARAVRQAGFEVGPEEMAATGRDALRRLALSADVDAVIVDAGVVDPELQYFLPQLRTDINVGMLPVLVLVGADRTGATPTLESQQRLQRWAEQFRNVWLVPQTTDSALLKGILSEKILQAFGTPLTEAERKEYAIVAAEWLARMARGEVSGTYDIRGAQKAILAALRTPELAMFAIAAVGHLPGPDAQRELAAYVLDGTRDAKLRSAAALELGRHIQQYGLTLDKGQIAGLLALYEQTPGGDEAGLKTHLALVLGTFRPDPTLTGLRLRAYSPSPPAPAKAETPEKKEK